MGYNLKNVRNGKSALKIARVTLLKIVRVCLYDSLNFRKI